MKKTRSKLSRAAMTRLLIKYPQEIKYACQAKIDRPSTTGRRQHRVISPRRQVKKQILRHGLNFNLTSDQ